MSTWSAPPEHSSSAVEADPGRGPGRADSFRIRLVFIVAIVIECAIGAAGVVFSFAGFGEDGLAPWALIIGSILVPLAVVAFVWLDRNASAPRAYFVAALAVLGVIGTTWMILVAANAGDTGGAVLSVGLGIIPVPLVVASFLWIDRYEPEPVRYLLAAIAWGGVVAPALVQPGYELLTRADTSLTLLLTVWAPVCEEIAKGLFIVIVVWRRREQISGVVDGLAYAGLVGIGFAFTENVLYIARGYAGDLDESLDGAGGATGVFIARGLLSPFSHSLFACAFGIGIGVAVATRRRWLKVVAPVLGLALAMGLHALWNGSTLLGVGFLVVYGLGFVPIFFAGIGLAAGVRSHQGRVAIRGLDDAVARGWLHPDEIPWLARFSLRRRARGFAARYGGPTAASALARYQKAALKMAFAHDRARQGRGPADGPERVRQLLAEMAQLRPYILMPPPLQLGPPPVWYPPRPGWPPPPPSPGPPPPPPGPPPPGPPGPPPGPYWESHTPPPGWPADGQMRQTGPLRGGHAASPPGEQRWPPLGQDHPWRATPPAESDPR